ncbi:MAG: selenium cofactor biosynthesis protein YqeC [Negativicutes bacterium]|jgi:probable selenium-dependent hydroxylase accessory protein YqeC
MSEINFVNCLFSRLVNNKIKQMAIIGGGGKSSLLIKLANAAGGIDCKTIFTTTTKMFFSEACSAVGEENCFCVTDYNQFSKIASLVKPAVPIFCFYRRDQEKLTGIPLEWIERATEMAIDVKFIYEADGSRGRSLKIHGRDEPVVGEAALVVAVVGLDAFNKPINADWIHRYELFAAIAEFHNDKTIDLVHLTHIINTMHRKLLNRDNFIVLLNKFDQVPDHEAVFNYFQKQRFDFEIIIGSLYNNNYMTIPKISRQ